MEQSSLEPTLLDPVPPNIARIPYSFFQKNGIVPLGCKQNPPALVVAVCEKTSSTQPDILGVFAKLPIEKKLVSEEEFENQLNVFKEEQGREVVIGVVEGLGQGNISDIAQELPSGHDLQDDAANEPPIIKLVNLIFSIAIQDRSSDIHIQPLENEVRVRFRIDGLLRQIL